MAGIVAVVAAFGCGGQDGGHDFGDASVDRDARDGATSGDRQVQDGPAADRGTSPSRDSGVDGSAGHAGAAGSGGAGGSSGAAGAGIGGFAGVGVTSGAGGASGDSGHAGAGGGATAGQGGASNALDAALDAAAESESGAVDARADRGGSAVDSPVSGDASGGAGGSGALDAGTDAGGTSAGADGAGTGGSSGGAGGDTAAGGAAGDQSADTGVPADPTPPEDDAAIPDGGADAVPDSADPGNPPDAAVPPADHQDAASPSSRYLTVVAHPDDDILFFNPDLENAMRQGASSLTLYVTSGDGSDPPWQRRETRVLNAQAGMADQATGWACATASYAGHPVERCVLSALPRISTIFMRLPDGAVMTLWDQSVSSLSRIDDPSTTYTSNELSATLAAIMAEVAPTNLLTMDSTASTSDDHPDHIASALFAREGARLYQQLDVLYFYRGYTSSLFDRNLSQAEHDEKVRLMDLYEAGVPVGSDYDDWCWRRYAYPMDVDTGQLR